MRDRASLLIFGRRELLGRILGRPLVPPYGEVERRASEQVRRHLLEEAEELYWNEMAWEHITGDEGLGDFAIPEMAFPGFLAFVRALLLDETLPQAKEKAQPRPDVVEDVLRFLGRRLVEIEDELDSGPAEDRVRLHDELSMTSRLIDRVLYRFHGLTAAEVERVEAGQVRH